MNVIKEKTDISIKICGISDIKTIKHCLNIGINWLGFVFFEKSPRHISFEKAIKFRKYIVKSNILNNSKVVALSVDATNSYLDKINETLNPDMFQLHGNETPSRCKFIKERYKKKVMKVIKVNDKNDIILSSKFNNDVDWYYLTQKRNNLCSLEVMAKFLIGLYLKIVLLNYHGCSQEV